MSRASDLGAAKVNAVLTNILKGYASPGYAADLIAPVVEVANDSGKVRSFGKEYFNHYDTKRALRADSKRVNLAGSTLVPYALNQYSLEVPIDDKEMRMGEEIDIKSRASKTATNGIQTSTEIELATLLQATGTYGSGMHTTLTSGNELNDADVDPVAFLNGLRNNVRQKIGKFPNTLLLSPDTETALLVHPLVVARLGNADLKILTRDQLAKMLLFENIIVPESVWNSAGTMTDIYTESAILYYSAPPAERSTENPSFIYTLRLKGETPAVVTEYRDEEIQSDIVRATVNQQFFVGTQDAAYLVKNTLA